MTLHRTLLRGVLAISFTLLVLHAAPSVAQVTFLGNEHTGLGGVVPVVSPDDHLLLRSIGESGQDGVSIALGQADGAAFSFLNSQAWAEDLVSSTLRLFGQVGGNEVDLGALQFREAGNTLELIGVPPPTPGTYEFDLSVVDDVSFDQTPYPGVSGGGLLGILDFGAGGPPQDFAASARLFPSASSPAPSGRDLEFLLGFDQEFQFGQPSGGPSIDQGRIVAIRMVQASTLGPVSLPDAATRLLLTSATAPGVSSIPEIDDEVLVAFDHGFRPIGQAKFTASVGRLEVGDLGPGGADGFSIQLGQSTADIGVESLELAHEAIHLDAASGQATGVRIHSPFRIITSHDANSPIVIDSFLNGKNSPGDSAGPLFEADIESDGDGVFRLLSDFNPIGATQFEIIVSQGGQVVEQGVADADNEFSLRVAPSPVRSPEMTPLELVYDPTEWQAMFFNPYEYRISKQNQWTPLDPDLQVTIAMRALGVVDPPESMTSIDFRYTGPSNVIITDFRALPEPASLALCMMAAVGAVAIVRRGGRRPNSPRPARRSS